MTAKTHIAIVLDRSGSMEPIRKATVDSVNSYLTEAKGDAKLAEGTVDIMIFDSASIDTIRSTEVAKVALLSEEDYQPRGSTPLYDAIGRGIDRLDQAKPDRAILVIVTDGYENASSKHTNASIKELITAKQAAGWLVVFLGAGLDVAAQGAALGVNVGTVASYAKSAAGMQNMASSVRSMSSAYAGAASTMDFVEQATFSAEERARMADEGTQVVPSPVPGAATAVPHVAGVAAMVVHKTPPAAKSDTWSKPGDAWGAS